MSITDIPVELMTADQRVERIGELRGAMRREWGRFVLTEVAVIFGPLVTFLAIYVVSDEISQHGLYAAVGILIVAETALVLYWLTWRIMPIGRRLEELCVQPFEDD